MLHGCIAEKNFLNQIKDKKNLIDKYCIEIFLNGKRCFDNRLRDVFFTVIKSIIKKYLHRKKNYTFFIYFCHCLIF